MMISQVFLDFYEDFKRTGSYFWFPRDLYDFMSLNSAKFEDGTFDSYLQLMSYVRRNSDFRYFCQTHNIRFFEQDEIKIWLLVAGNLIARQSSVVVDVINNLSIDEKRSMLNALVLLDNHYHLNGYTIPLLFSHSRLGNLENRARILMFQRSRYMSAEKLIASPLADKENFDAEYLEKIITFITSHGYHNPEYLLDQIVAINGNMRDYFSALQDIAHSRDTIMSVMSYLNIFYSKNFTYKQAKILIILMSVEPYRSLLLPNYIDAIGQSARRDEILQAIQIFYDSKYQLVYMRRFLDNVMSHESPVQLIRLIIKYLRSDNKLSANILNALYSSPECVSMSVVIDHMVKFSIPFEGDNFTLVTSSFRNGATTIKALLNMLDILTHSKLLSPQVFTQLGQIPTHKWPNLVYFFDWFNREQMLTLINFKILLKHATTLMSIEPNYSVSISHRTFLLQIMFFLETFEPNAAISAIEYMNTYYNSTLQIDEEAVVTTPCTAVAGQELLPSIVHPPIFQRLYEQLQYVQSTLLYKGYFATNYDNFARDFSLMILGLENNNDNYTAILHTLHAPSMYAFFTVYNQKPLTESIEFFDSVYVKLWQASAKTLKHAELVRLMDSCSAHRCPSAMMTTIIHLLTEDAWDFLYLPYIESHDLPTNLYESLVIFNHHVDVSCMTKQYLNILMTLATSEDCVNFVRAIALLDPTDWFAEKKLSQNIHSLIVDLQRLKLLIPVLEQMKLADQLTQATFDTLIQDDFVISAGKLFSKLNVASSSLEQVIAKSYKAGAQHFADDVEISGVDFDGCNTPFFSRDASFSNKFFARLNCSSASLSRVAASNYTTLANGVEILRVTAGGKKTQLSSSLINESDDDLVSGCALSTFNDVY